MQKMKCWPVFKQDPITVVTPNKISFKVHSILFKKLYLIFFSIPSSCKCINTLEMLPTYE